VVLRAEIPLSLTLSDGVDHGLDRHEDLGGRYPVTCQVRPTSNLELYMLDMDKSWISPSDRPSILRRLGIPFTGTSPPQLRLP
jgi:hypothetical protein